MGYTLTTAPTTVRSCATLPSATVDKASNLGMVDFTLITSLELRYKKLLLFWARLSFRVVWRCAARGQLTARGFAGVIGASPKPWPEEPMTPAQQTADDVRRNLAAQLDWQLAERNDAAVAQAVQAGTPIDDVRTLDAAALVEGCLGFLRHTGILAHWQTFTLEAVPRPFLPVFACVLLYGVRVLCGINSTNALSSLLFSNVPVMLVLGFTVEQVTLGMTHRGASLRTAASEYALLDPQTLANTISKASATALMTLFNGSIHCLAAFGVFMAEVMVAVDGTRSVTCLLYTSPSPRD